MPHALDQATNDFSIPFNIAPLDRRQPMTTQLKTLTDRADSFIDFLTRGIKENRQSRKEAVAELEQVKANYSTLCTKTDELFEKANTLERQSGEAKERHGHLRRENDTLRSNMVNDKEASERTLREKDVKINDLQRRFEELEGKLVNDKEASKRTLREKDVKINDQQRRVKELEGKLDDADTLNSQKKDP